MSMSIFAWVSPDGFFCDPSTGLPLGFDRALNPLQDFAGGGIGPFLGEITHAEFQIISRFRLGSCELELTTFPLDLT